MKRKFVPIFLDWLQDTQDLTQEEKGNLIDCLVLFYRMYTTGENILDRWCLDDKSAEIMAGIVLKISRFDKIQRSRPSGEFHWNWKGGKTPTNQRERSSMEYSEWRTSVFKRDNFTCQICGQVGGELQAHHIKHWSTNVDERYRISNGVTLCKKCHKELHKKGG